ncbi:GspH/FimT family pseudopilin [Lysobacter sp. A6]|uniref:Type II secretion system protein H n=1 Tax=Noviluteimonas lactosilytica TaxID=2888523 RepID=A0ABS8JJU0_9GAMM|nr:GspH/FimT family pseudopilin [Lysobacter lactosilyticus]MCC8363866.1 GspH/FimT family pseudopilin [Lysobacter lactosilyticus]
MPARSYKPAKASSGFTLLELMVTIVVFVILAALAVPGLSTYLEKSRLRGAADSVVNQLAQARQAAVKYDRNVSLKTTGSGATWCLGAREAGDPAEAMQAGAASTCDCAATPTECVVDKDKQLVVKSDDYRGVTLSSAAGDLAFDGRLGIRSDASVGNANASSFDLTSQSGAYVLTVNISPLGQATVCTKTGNILGYPQC